ncbi:MAG: tRNA lysidine(34) synthetase TilS [Acidobacteriota bacterium]|nr:tRNA lysidine(34) synthetase TilS [Acidobacteriota bacterium]
MLLAERVLASMRRHTLIPPGGRVLAAVSGGSDSVALLYLLADFARRGVVTLAGMAHLNHQLRGTAADDDERFCRMLAARFRVPCLVDTVTVAQVAKDRGISVEHAGHQLRGAFFERAAAEAAAGVVAVGHTRDDQAETVMLRLLRGTGVSGLSAMRPRSGVVVRPLLAVGHSELRVYLKEQGGTFREDATNNDLAIPRNRVRHELMPQLRSYSPQAIEALTRQAEIARWDDDWLRQSATELGAEIVIERDGVVEVDAARLVAAHPALARRVAWNALVAVAGAGAVGFDQVERLRQVAAGGPEPIDLRRCRVERRAGIVRVVARVGRAATSGPRPTGFVYRLDVPGTLQVSEAGMAMTAEVLSAQVLDGASNGCVSESYPVGRSTHVLTAVLALPVALPLIVRSWLPGDRIRPLGLNGHRKKVQDIFVDRKVPRANRARTPIVLDAAGRIVWVVGHGMSHDFRVTDGVASVLILKVRSLGDIL